MRKVPNRKIIRRLSMRTMKEKRGKNLIAIAAVALTSLLFTALFTVGMSMIDSIEEATMRQVGTSAHGGYKHLRKEEYEKVRHAPGIRDISCNIVAGFGVNPELKDIQTEVRYSEEKSAAWGFSLPEEGRMPESGAECATSTKVLDALGIPHKVGERVPLDVRIGKNVVKEDFTLTGWWEDTGVSHAEQFWISREWLTAHVPEPSLSWEENVLSGGNESGYLHASILLPSSYDIEKQMNDISEWAGFGPETRISVNWAYLTSGMDATSILLLSSVLLIIILSGYLVIYNIFYINVASDIRYYGLLKTIGTTGRQLKSMVRGQAFLLSAAGIPLGLLAGWFVGRGILPLLFQQIDSTVKKVSLNFWIFAGSAVFSLLVVYLSCIRPCRLASKASPIEAVRYVEWQTPGKKRSGGGNGRRKKTGRINMFRLAAANMRRSRKKSVIVILSLSLCLSLLNAVWTLVSGFSFEKYTQDYLAGDMLVKPDKYMDFAADIRNTDKITDDMREKVEALPGVESVEENYLKDTLGYLSEETRERLSAFVETCGQELGDERLWKDEYDMIREDGEIVTMVYGIPEIMLSRLKVLEGAFDPEKFRTGRGVLVEQRVGEGNREPWLKPGDKIQLSKGGEELEVMAVVQMPYGMGAQYSLGSFRLKVYVDAGSFEEVLLESQGDRPKGGLNLVVNTLEGEEEKAGQALSALLEREYPELTVVSREKLREEFSSFTGMFFMIGGLLCLILGLIGVLNFMNAMITGILSRKQEFAIMEAVGMTGRQLRRMLISEGLLYAVWTVIVTMTVGNSAGLLLIRAIGGGMDYFIWHFTLLPALCGIPFLVLVSVAVPFVSFHVMCKKSIVDRIRMAGL